MKLIRTDRFRDDYRSLPAQIRKQTDRKLWYLAQDLRHPSLRVKRVRKYRDIYEGRINLQYRFLFQITTDAYILLRLGKHDVLEQA